MKSRWLQFALSHPRWVFSGLVVAVIGLGTQMAKVQIDTDPENMLSEDEPVRVFHDEVKERFQLHDMVVVGIERPEHPEGVFTPESLGRIYELSKRVEDVEHVVTADLMGPAHVDDIREAGPGTVTFKWLLKEPPETQAEADQVRESAKRLPMLDGTLISEDGKSLAIYVPVEEKSYSYQVSRDIKEIIADLDGPETYHFAGLPVAEDTFGFEMFKQMAISAPLAALVIFLLMWWFFRSLALVVSPMIVAMSTVIMTMGALIGAGFTVHIMSSMIPIFLMPIAVVDSVHILSEFADLYPKHRDAKKTIREVVGHLFMPMLYTSLTSAAGFLSLLITPIPPVQVFGAFVALGILLAFLLTIVFIPAYVVSLSPKRLAALVSDTQERGSTEPKGLLVRAVRGLRTVGLGAPKIVVAAAVLLIALGSWGISLIQINDNPVRWFRASHPIRQADETLNRALAGTYPAYLVVEPTAEAEDPIEAARAVVQKSGDDARLRVFEDLVEDAESGVASALDTQSFEDPEGEDIWIRALQAFETAESEGRVFQDPTWLAWIERLQQAAADLGTVGKTTSVADVVKTVHRELKGGDAEAFRVPDSKAGVAQTLLTFQSSHRPQDLFHVVTPDYRAAAVWFQLRSGDNQDMSKVRDGLDAWISDNPPPAEAEARWAGLTYINVVWQEKMVQGMLESLLGAFVVVFIMMVLLFRSVLFGLLSMVPLMFTIVLIYGLTGFIGKDYDMPVAVLSSLSLGLSIDFAIHFLERSRQLRRETGSWQKALPLMFEEPGRAIARNAIVIAIGFLPLLAAPLVPYNTVGVLMAAIMAVSSLVTLVLLPAILWVGNRVRPAVPASGAHPQPSQS
jgi:hypothetical protein